MTKEMRRITERVLDKFPSRAVCFEWRGGAEKIGAGMACFRLKNACKKFTNLSTKCAQLLEKQKKKKKRVDSN